MICCLKLKKYILQDVFQMTAITLKTHLNSSSEVVSHPDALFFFFFFGMVQIFWLMPTAMYCEFNDLEIKIWGVQIGWIRRPLGFAAPADQPIKGIDGRATLSWCWLYLKFLLLVETISHLESHHDVFQVQSKTCSAYQCNSNCLLVRIYRAKRSDYCFEMATQPVHFWSTSFRASAPQYTVIAIDMSPEPEVYFIAEPNITKKESSSILFSNHRHITKRCSTSAGVILCFDLDSVWVQLKILLWYSLQWCT